MTEVRLISQCFLDVGRVTILDGLFCGIINGLRHIRKSIRPIAIAGLKIEIGLNVRDTSVTAKSSTGLPSFNEEIDIGITVRFKTNHSIVEIT